MASVDSQLSETSGGPVPGLEDEQPSGGSSNGGAKSRRTRARSRMWRLITVGALLIMVEALVFAAWGTTNPGAVGGKAARLSPSVELAPKGDLPGWRQIFVDEFDGTSLSQNWGVYDGVPGGDPNSRWSPSHVTVKNSQLILQAYQENNKWITGGVSNHVTAQTYGKWEVRFRADRSDEIPLAFLLWPQGGDWPPEIDFYEDGGGARSDASGFVHYKSGGPNGRSDEHRSLVADFTQWHTVGVEWTAGSVVFTLDGSAWAEVTGSFVPAQPMWLAMQAQAGGCQRRVAIGQPLCPIAGIPAEANVYIDWVSVWAPAG